VVFGKKRRKTQDKGQKLGYDAFFGFSSLKNLNIRASGRPDKL
jgi:hypothetical protein